MYMNIKLLLNVGSLLVIFSAQVIKTSPYLILQGRYQVVA